MARLNIVVTILMSAVYIQAKITVEKLEICDPKEDYAIVFTTTLKEENDRQVLEDGALKSKVDMNDNIEVLLEVYSFEGGNWNYMVDLTGTLCQLILKYLEDLSAAIEKAAGLTNTCPYPKGEYQVSNVTLNFDNVPFAPEGKYSVNVTMRDIKEKNLLSCLTIESTVDNSI